MLAPAPLSTPILINWYSPSAFDAASHVDLAVLQWIHSVPELIRRFGSSVPELQTVARLVLSQPASASLCERINSEFEFVKDRRRNRLGHTNANMLVGLFHNLRMLKRMKSPNYTESTIAWSEDLESSRVIQYNPASAAPRASLSLVQGNFDSPPPKYPLSIAS